MSSSSSRQTATRGRKRAHPGELRTVATTLQPSISRSPDEFNIDCPVCYESMAEPKVLHCGHNLCAECVANVQTRGGGRQSQWRYVKCPECRQVSKLARGVELATNYGLKDLARKAQDLKKFYESPTNAASRLTPTSSSNLIKCTECGAHSRRRDSFACISGSCAEKKRRWYNYHEWAEELELWDAKGLCGACACRKHRRHDVEELSAVVDGNQAASEVIYISKGESTLNEQYHITKGLFNNSLSKVTEHYQIALREARKKLTETGKPLLIKDFQTIGAEATAVFTRATTFLSKEAKLKALAEEFKDRLFDEYMKDDDEEEEVENQVDEGEEDESGDDEENDENTGDDEEEDDEFEEVEDDEEDEAEEDEEDEDGDEDCP